MKPQALSGGALVVAPLEPAGREGVRAAVELEGDLVQLTRLEPASDLAEEQHEVAQPRAELDLHDPRAVELLGDDRPRAPETEREVFRQAVQRLSEVVDEALHANHLTAADIDWLVPHQANSRIIDGIGRKLALPPEKIVVTNFRVQRLYGQAVLTWWQGLDHYGRVSGVGMIYDRNYQLVARVSAGKPTGTKPFCQASPSMKRLA